MTAPKRLRDLAIAAALAAIPAACAPQTAGVATAPPSANLSSGPGGSPPAGMQGMDHSNMPGMSQGGMQGMDMQGMMAHCAQMRQQSHAGMAMSPDMRQMMAHCNEMDRGISSQGTTATQRGR